MLSTRRAVWLPFSCRDGLDGGGEAACETSRMSRLSLPYAAKDLAQNLVPDPSPAVSVVVVVAAAVVAVTSPFD